MTDTSVAADRWELLRALAAVADKPAAARAVGPALGLAAASDAEHTGVFVLDLPPYASIYLGPDGALGGEGADRIAGFWRVMGIEPPSDSDHLSSLLGLYASMGEGITAARKPTTVAALSRAHGTLFWEHLWPWLPAYLDAVGDLPAPALAGWADLLRNVVTAEAARQQACPALPAALRDAPRGVGADTGLGDLASLLTVPVRSGMIVTRHRLTLGAGQAGVGCRVGERRFTMRAMIEQDPAATLRWLAAEALRWQRRHQARARGADDPAARWWAERAADTARALRDGAAAMGSAATDGGSMDTDAMTEAGGRPAGARTMP
jgi:TorA maturation chaperone TorD